VRPKGCIRPLADDGRPLSSEKEFAAAAIVSGDPLAWPDHDPYNAVEPFPESADRFRNRS
jgi:hypothetical protein